MIEFVVSLPFYYVMLACVMVFFESPMDFETSVPRHFAIVLLKKPVLLLQPWELPCSYQSIPFFFSLFLGVGFGPHLAVLLVLGIKSRPSYTKPALSNWSYFSGPQYDFF